MAVSEVRRGTPVTESRVRITPSMAHEWLGFNTHNRPLSRTTVSRFARDMKEGRWPYTGDPIRFNGKGTLIDGQHRLHACIEADVPFEAVVIRGLPVDVQEKIDQGRKRTAGDFLVLRGFVSGVKIAAAVRQLCALRDPNVKGRGKIGGMGMTNAEVLETFERHPMIEESVAEVGQPIIGIHASLIAAMHYMGAHLLNDQDTADSFAAVFKTGVPAYEGDPAHLWRERLARHVRTNALLTQRQRRLGTIYAWNAFRRRETLSILRIPEQAEIEGLDVSRI